MQPARWHMLPALPKVPIWWTGYWKRRWSCSYELKHASREQKAKAKAAEEKTVREAGLHENRLN